MMQNSKYPSRQVTPHIHPAWGLLFFLVTLAFPHTASAALQESDEDVRQMIEESGKIVTIHPERAIQMAKTALKKAETLGEDELTVDALNNLGMIYYRRNQLEEAEKVLLKAIEISEASGYLKGSGIATNRLGSVYWIMEKRIEAKNLFDRALAIHTERGDVLETSRTLNNLANAYRYWDDYPRAIELLLEARKGYQEVDYREGSAWLSYSLGLLYKKLEDYESALDSMNSALEIYQDLAAQDGSYNGVMICYGQLGDIYNRTGKPARALEYHQRALRLRRDSRNQAAIADGLNGVGESYFFLGDLEKAEDYFLRSQKIRESTGQLDGTASNMLFLGRIYQEEKESAKALAHFLRGLDAARELNDRDTESEILGLIASLHGSEGRYWEAWNYLQQHQRVEDLIMSAEISKAVASLQMQYQIEEQVEENERLQAENQIKDLQLARSRTLLLLLIALILFAVTGGIGLVFLHRKQKHITRLQGLIPICTHCKSIRSDSGFYEQLETYISEHSEAEFSHGICPDCYKKYYSDLLEEDSHTMH